MSESVDSGIRGPIFGIAHRDAVEWEGETAVVVDHNLLLKMEVTAGLKDVLALLLYTRREYAVQFLESRKNEAWVAARSRSPAELAAYLESSGCPWVMLNRIPGKHDGSICTGSQIIEALNRWMAHG